MEILFSVDVSYLYFPATSIDLNSIDLSSGPLAHILDRR